MMKIDITLIYYIILTKKILADGSRCTEDFCKFRFYQFYKDPRDL
jgi:hypothetical protein